jgi:hypothetical protein
VSCLHAGDLLPAVHLDSDGMEAQLPKRHEVLDLLARVEDLQAAGYEEASLQLLKVHACSALLVGGAGMPHSAAALEAARGKIQEQMSCEVHRSAAGMSLRF